MSEKKKDELTEDELDSVTGGAGTADALKAQDPKLKKPTITIQKIPSKVGPTLPGFNPGKHFHSPNNAA